MITSRRKFIKHISLGASGLLFAPYIIQKDAYGLTTAELPNSSVSFISGTNRRQMISDVLAPFESEIQTGIQGKQIIIKPNNVYHGAPLCATHADAIRGVIDFLTQITNQKIIIAESPASTNGAMSLFNEYGYTVLDSEYTNTIELMDLDDQNGVQQQVLADETGENFNTIKINEPFLDSNNYIISLGIPKSHNCAVATLCSKNIFMAAPMNRNGSQKVTMHGVYGSNYEPEGAEMLTNNMFLVANKVMPNFAVLDGFEGMQGEGPIDGTAVQHHIALAGPDCIAVDMIGIKLMGVNPDHMVLQKWCGNGGLGQNDYNKIDLINGENLNSHIITYQLHSTVNTQIAWIGNDPVSLDRYTPTPFMSIENKITTFNGSALVNFSLPKPVETRLHVYNIKGSRIRELVSTYLKAGRYRIQWDGRDDYGTRVSAGAYLIQLQTGHKKVSEKISLFR